MNHEFDERKPIIESLPGPVKVLIVEIPVAAAMIFGGLPLEYTVGALTVGNMAALILRKRFTNDDRTDTQE